MTSSPDEQRIERELSKRKTCSFRDLKSALKLSGGDIKSNINRLADRRFVRIEKDHRGEHVFYTWTGPKERGKAPDSARSMKAKGKRTVSPGVPLEVRERGVGTNAKKKQPASLKSLPADWKDHLRQIISNPPRYYRHPKERDLMLLWLRDDFCQKDKLESAAMIIWKASRKRHWNIEDPPDFFEHFEYLLLSLAISVTTPDPPLTAKALQVEIDTLKKLIKDKPFFREGPAREELDREINVLKNRAERASKTKPNTPGRRTALQFLLQYLQDVLEMKQPHLAARLLIYIGHHVMWAASSSRTRAAEQTGRNASGVKNVTAVETTKETWAALDELKGEKFEAALERMSPKQRDLYLRSR
jgi:hypothetical protein